ncbi:MAG: tripartite tricarboxylate transporter permease [Rhodospirillales bacterium]|nr:tripartite tricarboxylate transporter permease [Rhodospirillales bacterium]
MDMFLAAVATVFEPANIAILLASTAAGIVIGAIPGLTVTMAIALAVPLTITMPLTPSLLMLLGLYGAGIYGGSISAVLINTPGTPASAATSIDGYELAKQGKALKALKMALIASFYGGLFSVVLLVVIAPQLAAFALKFGPAEICSLLIFALTIVAVLSGDTIIKGLLAAAIGMLIATIGADPMLSVPRFTFGVYDLYDGLAYIPLLIGLFAIAEMLAQAEESFTTGAKLIDIKDIDKDANRLTRDDWRRSVVPMIRSGFLGSFVGMLPGLGAAIATFLGYAEAKRASKEPERFGKGAIEGVAASESANNAVTGSAMIPMLALAIPGDPPTAILLGALLIQGVTTGPLIFVNHPDVVYTVYVALFASLAFMGMVGWLALKPIVQVLKVPKVLLYPVILAMCAAGSYAIRNSIFDVFVMVGAGLLGYALRLFGVPVAPLLIAFILCPPLEESMRQALIKSQGSLMIFLNRPISAFFLLLALAAIVFTVRRQIKSHQALPSNI